MRNDFLQQVQNIQIWYFVFAAMIGFVTELSSGYNSYEGSIFYAPIRSMIHNLAIVISLIFLVITIFVGIKLLIVGELIALMVWFVSVVAYFAGIFCYQLLVRL